MLRLVGYVCVFVMTTSCGFEKSADMAWMGARDAVNRGYQHSEREVQNCFQRNGCSLRGPEGSAGPVGPTGDVGSSGTNGSSCSVSATTYGALITCDDGTSTSIKDGTSVTGPIGPAGTSCTTTPVDDGAIIACEDGTNSFISDGRGGDVGPQGEFSSLVLVAAKSYGPSTWYDASWSGNEVTVKVPAILPVLAGNAGNHWATLTLNGVDCKYKGGADVSKPLSPYNQSQVNKGGTYLIDSSCPFSAGDEVDVYSVTFTVNNGDSTATTVVQTSLQVVN